MKMFDGNPGMANAWPRMGRLARLLATGGMAAQAALAGTAHAQDTQPSTAADGDIIVTGYRYLSEDTSGTTNLPLPVEKVPQAISLVSEDFLKAADLRTLGEVAQHTPGAIFAGNPQGFGSVVKLRGFTGGTAIDGLTVGSLDYEPDYATIERMEIVKGPASVVYGAASPGGLINLVTKSAKADTASYVEALGGSWDRWRIEGQLAGALNAEGTVRAIGIAAHEEADSFMKIANSSKTVIYAGLDFDIADGFTGYVHGGYDRYRRSAFDGIPTLPDGSPAPVGRSFFIGSHDFNLTSKVGRVSAGLDWEVSPVWSISLKTNYQNTDTDGPSAFGFGLEEDGDFLIAAQNFLKNKREDFSVGLSSIYKLDETGLMDSFISVSALYQDTELTTVGGLPDFPEGPVAEANIFDGVKAIEAIINTAQLPGFTYEYGQRLEYLTLSGQAVIKVADPVTLLAGLSWSKPDVSSRLDGPWVDYSRGGEMSYRGAITVEPISGLNVYASYSESFQPQLRVDVDGAVLPPLTGSQYEIGVKYVSPDRRLLLTAALFDLNQKNKGLFVEQGPDGTDRYKAVGKTRHRGLELEAVGQITAAWQIHAGFALLDPKITRDDNPDVIDKTVPFLPKSTASLYTSYEFGGGAFVGGGIRYVDSVKTDFDRVTKDLPSYFLVDGSIGYDFDRYRVQLNVKNIFDEHYYINNYETLFYGNVVGEPRSFAVSVRANF
ncbi:ferrichrome-iron receptor [Sphingomonas sp. DBB INV C78]|uniref:TonB-dependent siderophore receptor n=1 Tax=Sphingomonas sp. DBB INV C78 TaxID=3349434 RepID=UPI0036D20AB9